MSDFARLLSDQNHVDHFFTLLEVDKEEFKETTYGGDSALTDHFFSRYTKTTTLCIA